MMYWMLFVMAWVLCDTSVMHAQSSAAKRRAQEIQKNPNLNRPLPTPPARPSSPVLIKDPVSKKAPKPLPRRPQKPVQSDLKMGFNPLPPPDEPVISDDLKKILQDRADEKERRREARKQAEQKAEEERITYVEKLKQDENVLQNRQQDIAQQAGEANDFMTRQFEKGSDDYWQQINIKIQSLEELDPRDILPRQQQLLNQLTQERDEIGAARKKQMNEKIENLRKIVQKRQGTADVDDEPQVVPGSFQDQLRSVRLKKTPVAAKPKTQTEEPSLQDTLEGALKNFPKNIDEKEEPVGKTPDDDWD